MAARLRGLARLCETRRVILVRVAYTAAIVILVVWLLKTGRPLGGLLIVPLAAIWLRHEAESGEPTRRVRRGLRL